MKHLPGHGPIWSLFHYLIQNNIDKIRSAPKLWKSPLASNGVVTALRCAATATHASLAQCAASNSDSPAESIFSGAHFPRYICCCRPRAIKLFVYCTTARGEHAVYNFTVFALRYVDSVFRFSPVMLILYKRVLSCYVLEYVSISKSQIGKMESSIFKSQMTTLIFTHAARIAFVVRYAWLSYRLSTASSVHHVAFMLSKSI